MHELAANSNIVVSTPFPVDSILKPDTASDVVEKTYLDTTGRPTIILKKANCGDKHGEDIIVRYSLSLPIPSFFRPPLFLVHSKDRHKN